MQSAKLLTPENSSSESAEFLHALGSLLLKQEKGMLVSMVLRAGSSMKLMIAQPMPHTPSLFVLNEVPYLEDISQVKTDPLPAVTNEQKEAALQLVDSMMLPDIDLEDVANPTLHRAVSFLSRRFYDSSAQISSEHTWEEILGLKYSNRDAIKQFYEAHK